MKQDVAPTLSLSELLRPQSSGAPQQARANGASFDATLEKSLDSAKRAREAFGFDRGVAQFDGNRPPQRPEHLRLDRQSFEDRVQDRLDSRRDDARRDLAGYQDRQRQFEAIQGTVDRLREYFNDSNAPQRVDGQDLPEGLDESQVAQLRALANGEISLDELSSEELASLQEALNALGDALGIELDLEDIADLAASEGGFFDALQTALAQQAAQAKQTGNSSDSADDLTPELTTEQSADTPDATLTVEKTDGKNTAAATSTPATEAPLGNADKKASAAKADGDAERIHGKQAGKATQSSAKPDTPATAGANVANQTQDTDESSDASGESSEATDEVTNDDNTQGTANTDETQGELAGDDALDTHQRKDQHAGGNHGEHGKMQAGQHPSNGTETAGVGAAEAASQAGKASEGRRASDSKAASAQSTQSKTDADIIGKYTSNVVESEASDDSDASTDGDSANNADQADTPEGEAPAMAKSETAPAPLEEAKLGAKLSLLEQSQQAKSSAPESSVEKGTAATRSLRNAGPVGLDNTAKVINFTARETQSTTQSSEAKHVVKMANQQAMIDKITSNLRMMVGRNQSMIRMDLNPPELGKMTMRLNLRNDQLHAHLKVHSIEARELIGSNLDQLRDSLAKQGVDVHSVSVDVDAREGRGEAFTRQYRWQAQQHANKTSFGQFLNGSEEASSSARAVSIMQADRLDLIA